MIATIQSVEVERRETAPMVVSMTEHWSSRTSNLCGFVALLVLGFLPSNVCNSTVESESGNQWRGGQAPVHGYQIVRVYPHDRTAFTQGLLYRDGFLYEGTGLNGRSTLRKVRLETGEVLQQQALGPEYFGEGITDWDADLVQLTWRSNVGFVYDRPTFKMKRRFQYTGEGWGLTHDTTRLIMSDGTSSLRFLDPRTLAEIGRMTVRERSAPVMNLNELEYVRGEIYANVWQSDRIARISPRTGQVVSWINLSGLLGPSDRAAVDVLNGIAYDAAKDRLFVTGKLWPKLFEIKVGGMLKIRE